MAADAASALVLANLPDWARPAADRADLQRVAHLREALQILEELIADPATHAAAIAHALDCWDEVGQAVPEASQLQPGLADAGRIWSLHGGSSAGGNAEGLRRLLLAIVRDLRVVPILLARQLARGNRDAPAAVLHIARERTRMHAMERALAFVRDTDRLLSA